MSCPNSNCNSSFRDSICSNNSNYTSNIRYNSNNPNTNTNLSLAPLQHRRSNRFKRRSKQLNKQQPSKELSSCSNNMHFLLKLPNSSNLLFLRS
mmetsp:Transcript_95722/g.275853  ORF Transcript_95722/g.275853 Transcript_95722/m.275853 type:complete len:94 (-) Transcript_95722:1148-1429(-)